MLERLTRWDDEWSHLHFLISDSNWNLLTLPPLQGRRGGLCGQVKETELVMRLVMRLGSGLGSDLVWVSLEELA